MDCTDINDDVLKMIWTVGSEKAIEILQKYGYTHDQLKIVNNEVTILNPFGVHHLLDDENSDEYFMSQEVISNDEISSDLAADDLNDTLRINYNDNTQIPKTIEKDGKVIYKSNAINNMIHLNTKISTDRAVCIHNMKSF